MKYLKMFETSIPHIPVKYNYSYVYFDGGTPYDHYAKVIGLQYLYGQNKVQYKIEVFDLDKNKLVTLNNVDTEIKRKLKLLDLFSMIQ